MSTHAEVKRMVIGGRKTNRYDQAKLYLAEHEGELFATNSYWLTPAYRVAPLLEQFNLPTKEPGAYVVSGKVETLPTDTPNLSAIMPRVDTLHDIERATIDDTSKPAYCEGGTGFLALLRNEGVLVAVNADFLAWIESPFPAGTVRRDVTYKQSRPLGPVYIAEGETFLGLLMPVRI